MRRVPVLLLPAVLAVAATVSCSAAVSAAPPPPPGAEEVRTQLAELTVAPEGSGTGYDRGKFPHWSDQGNNCNTRETVLKRDGENVQVGSDCYPTSGSWTKPSDLDIEHMVPLSEAWRSGASAWTTQRRRAFANDLESPQLWAVTDNVNQAKGDKDPAEWKPPLGSFHCTYARSWIDVKHRYGLTVDEAEKGALGGMLDRC
ncbi:HNH endonuclease family protein [Actinomadura sp. LOL_016]|uniref:HNH endonuclease family protein n=1 Tax=unclassified Actinomadura TaxID=2626254 RepID=UPI003A80BAD3